MTGAAQWRVPCRHLDDHAAERAMHSQVSWNNLAYFPEEERVVDDVEEADLIEWLERADRADRALVVCNQCKRVKLAGGGTDLLHDGGNTVTQVGHCRHDHHDVYIGRGESGDAHLLNTPVGERGWLGNPFPVSEHGRVQCIDRFRVEFEARLADDAEFRAAVRALAGSVLGCWCQRLADDGPACHGEVIAEHADRLAADD